MKIGVPGEFHEDRWQRTAEDSERCMLPLTREVGGTHRIQVIAWRRGLLAGLRHGSPAHRYLSAISAWRRGLPAALWHGDHAHKYSRGIPAWRRGHLSTLWHGDPQQNHFWGRGTWQDCLEPVSNRSLADASAGLRHGIPGERPLGGIMAWRSVLLTVLRHGDPAHRCLSGILAEPL